MYGAFDRYPIIMWATLGAFAFNSLHNLPG